MDQIFSFKRYLLLMKRQWYENAGIYKSGILLMAISLIFMYAILTSWKETDHLRMGQVGSFALVSMFFLYTFGDNFFESLKSKPKGMFYFSLPVSPLERVAVAFTCVMVLMPAIFVIIFFPLDFLAVKLFNHIHGASEGLIYTKTLSLPHRTVGFFTLISSGLTFSSIFVLCSLFFGKKIFIKLAIYSLVFLFFSIFSFLHYNLNHDIISPLDFFTSGIFILIAPLCWISMYFVLKNKEV